MSGLLPQDPYANKPSSSLQKTISSESLPPPPGEWRKQPSTEARGKGIQHERRRWVNNDLNAWHIAKIRQHSKDPSKTAGRSGFEGRFVSPINDAFSQLIRRLIRGGGGASNEHGGECTDPWQGTESPSGSGPDYFNSPKSGRKGK